MLQVSMYCPFCLCARNKVFENLMKIFEHVRIVVRCNGVVNSSETGITEEDRVERVIQYEGL